MRLVEWGQLQLLLVRAFRYFAVNRETTGFSYFVRVNIFVKEAVGRQEIFVLTIHREVLCDSVERSKSDVLLFVIQLLNTLWNVSAHTNILKINGSNDQRKTS